MKSVFERPAFSSNGQITCWRVQNKVRNELFNLEDWKIIHMNKRSLTLRNIRSNEYFLIGKYTLNKVLNTPSTRIQYVQVPHLKDEHILVNWIKLDTK